MGHALVGTSQILSICNCSVALYPVEKRKLAFVTKTTDCVVPDRTALATCTRSVNHVGWNCQMDISNKDAFPDWTGPPDSLNAAVPAQLMATLSDVSSNAAAMRVRVYSARGFSKIWPASPLSTISPSFMTIILCASERTTLRSWLMNR